MSDLYELRCRECGKTWGNAPKSFCEDCFSPLEVSYDYDSLKKKVRRENLAGRTFNMWRYAELLPLPEDFTPASAVGGTPLVASRKLASHWGIGELYFKNDAVCFPSLSFQGPRRWHGASGRATIWISNCRLLFHREFGERGCRAVGSAGI